MLSLSSTHTHSVHPQAVSLLTLPSGAWFSDYLPCVGIARAGATELSCVGIARAGATELSCVGIARAGAKELSCQHYLISRMVS